MHLGIGADCSYALLINYAKVPQLLQLCLQLRVWEAHGPALDRMKDLSRMKGEHTGISKGANPPSVQGFSKGMSCVVDYFKPMLLCDPFYFFCIADIPIYMDWKDGRSLVRDKGLYSFGIHSIVRFPYVAEYRSHARSYNGMGSRGESERGRNHFSRKVHGLQGKLQGHMSIREEFHQRYSQIAL